MKKRRPWFLILGVKPIFSLILLTAIMVMLFSPRFWQKVYPIYFYQTILRESMISQVNPLLVAAVARVESHFREDDISHAGAIGLMQLMPDTAKWVAKNIHIAGVKSADLAQPDLNVRLGSWYLKYLLIQFHGKLPEAIAAYNAGPNRVKEWLAEGVWSGKEITAEDIPLSETSHFVQRVMYTYRIFSRFY